MTENEYVDTSKEADDMLKDTYLESEDATRKKLRRVEDSYRLIAEQKLVVYDQILRKGKMIRSAKAEAAMNETALKKLSTENQNLATDCSNLISQVQKWESKCALFERERNALLDSGNEADEKAEIAERKAQELHEMLGKVSEELKLYKANSNVDEQSMLNSFLETHVKEECEDSYRLLLQATLEVQSCRELLPMWDRLKPSSRKVLLLAAKTVSLENGKRSLRANLGRAEEEVNFLYRDNNFLHEENKKLTTRLSNCGTKGNKRKTVDSTRPPLSPLPHNSKNL